MNELQKDNILTQIKALAIRKFPIIGCIKHDGYKIIALAQICSIDNSLVKLKDLVDSAHERVGNKADLVYVLAILAKQSKKSTERKQILEQAEKIIDEIPSIYEQIEHLQLLGYHNWVGEKNMGRHFFQKALELCKKTNDETNEKSQRRIIEMANKLDSNLAKSLLAIIDNDEGRIEARKNAQSQNSQIKLRELMQAGETPDRDQIVEGSNNLLVNASWNLLSRINARAISPIQIQSIYKYVSFVDKIDSYNLYPVLAWMIENSVRKYSETNTIGITIRPFFDSLSISLKYMLRLLEKTNNISAQNIISEPNYRSDDGILVKPQFRSKVFEFVSDWLKKRDFKTVIICDKYFEECCLELIETVKKVNSNCEFIILSSKEKQSKILKDNDSFSDISEIYQSYWRKYFSEDHLPTIELYIVMEENGKAFPIHDRYLVTDDSALHFGASINYCGVLSLTQVSECKGTSDAVIYEINKYAMRERNVSSKIIKYETISL